MAETAIRYMDTTKGDMKARRTHPTLLNRPRYSNPRRTFLKKNPQPEMQDCFTLSRFHGFTVLGPCMIFFNIYIYIERDPFKRTVHTGHRMEQDGRASLCDCSYPYIAAASLLLNVGGFTAVPPNWTMALLKSCVGFLNLGIVMSVWVRDGFSSFISNN